MTIKKERGRPQRIVPAQIKMSGGAPLNTDKPIYAFCIDGEALCSFSDYKAFKSSSFYKKWSYRHRGIGFRLSTQKDQQCISGKIFITQDKNFKVSYIQDNHNPMVFNRHIQNPITIELNYHFLDIYSDLREYIPFQEFRAGGESNPYVGTYERMKRLAEKQRNREREEKINEEKERQYQERQEKRNEQKKQQARDREKSSSYAAKERCSQEREANARKALEEQRIEQRMRREWMEAQEQAMFKKIEAAFREIIQYRLYSVVYRAARRITYRTFKRQV